MMTRYKAKWSKSFLRFGISFSKILLFSCFLLLLASSLIPRQITLPKDTMEDNEYTAVVKGKTFSMVPASFTRGPTVNLLYNTSVRIMWTTDTATQSTVDYGTTPAFGSSTTNTTSTTDHEVDLTGLTPNTKYYYRAGYGAEWSSTYEFKTAPSGDEAFSFLVYGDHRPPSGTHPPPELGQLLDLMIAQQPNFVISTGDHILSTTYAGWANYVAETDRIHHNASYWVTMGNHDQPENKNMTLWFEWPGESLHNYYSFDYGNSHFTILDGYVERNVLGDTQIAWMKADLAATNAKHRFLIVHQPLYATGSHLGDSLDADPVMRDYLWQLFENNSIEAVFVGHEHYYYRLQVGTITHVTAGGGGAPLVSATEFDVFPVEVYEKSYHYVKVDVNGDTTTYTTYDINDQIIDAFTTQSVLTPRPNVTEIRHIPSYPQPTIPVNITASIINSTTLTDVTCRYRLTTASDYTSVPMTLATGSTNLYCVALGPLADQQSYYYYIEVNDTEGANYRSLVKRFGIDTIPPTVSITQPTENEIVDYWFSIIAHCEDAIGIVYTEFYIDNVLIANQTYEGTSLDVPAGWDTRTVADGQHVIKVITYDQGGNSDTASVTVIVQNAETTPIDYSFIILVGAAGVIILVIVSSIAVIILRRRKAEAKS